MRSEKAVTPMRYHIKSLIVGIKELVERIGKEVCVLEIREDA
jgi:hypothetical protein